MAQSSAHRNPARQRADRNRAFVELQPVRVLHDFVGLFARVTTRAGERVGVAEAIGPPPALMFKRPDHDVVLLVAHRSTVPPSQKPDTCGQYGMNVSVNAQRSASVTCE